MCIHIYIYIYICIFFYFYLYIYIPIHVYIHILDHILIYKPNCFSLSLSLSLSIYIYIWFQVKLNMRFFKGGSITCSIQSWNNKRCLTTTPCSKGAPALSSQDWRIPSCPATRALGPSCKEMLQTTLFVFYRDCVEKTMLSFRKKLILSVEKHILSLLNNCKK